MVEWYSELCANSTGVGEWGAWGGVCPLVLFLALKSVAFYGVPSSLYYMSLSFWIFVVCSMTSASSLACDTLVSGV